MPWPRNVSAPGQLQAELQRRLDKLGRVFDLPALRRQALAAAEVVSYYDVCHDAFRKYHSSEGALHMALNEGSRFDASGFQGQLQRLSAAWAAQAPGDVLELACGQGYNLGWLAQRFPAGRFAGIDLTPVQLQLAQRRVDELKLRSVALQLGDFHALPYADGQFDEVFCIEGFCHAIDVPRALAEVARVLRPGGRFTLFDGYLPRPPQQLQAHEALAVELVARGMAIERLQVEGELVDAAREAGLSLLQSTALDAQVAPSLRRLERITGAVIRFPWLGRRALARRHPDRGRNVLAGYLMRNTVALGLIGYRHLVLRKEGPGGA